MKKFFLVLCLALLSTVLIYGYADAAVSGVCGDCHTMHNSQNGGQVTPVGVDSQSGLLNNTCLGCHTTDTTDPLDGGKPRVKSTVMGGFTNSNSLAGGFFAVNDSTGSHTDKAHSLGNTNIPAGLDVTENNWYTGDASGLSCAGTNGCHGDETKLDGDSNPIEDDMTSIKGGHHSPTAYRILYVGGSAVQGTGAADFEKDLIANATDGGTARAHNTYSAGDSDPSISELCAKCHSDFHGDTDIGGPSGPWTRHPTNVNLPATWTLATATMDELDWKHNPVGYDDANEANSRRVICVSCHRAHGTEYNDNLRWLYNDASSDQSAGSGNTYGCLGCHNGQR